MGRVLVAIVSMLLCMPLAWGQEPERLSLEEALQIAWQRNPRLLQARQEVEAARGRWIQDRALPNPELEVSATELSQGLKGGSTVGDDSIALSQEVDVLGKFWLRGKAGKADYQATQHLLQRVWSEVAFEVTQAYNHLLLSTQRIGVAREVLTLTRGLFDQVQLRYNAGEVLRNELLRAQIEAAKAENAVLEADKQITLDTAALNILLGRDAQQSLALIDQFTYQPQDIDPDQLLTQALQQRPDLKAREAAIRAQRNRWRLALSNILDNPTVSAIGTRETGEAGKEQVFGLAIRWPIPFWNQNRGAIREAKAELTRREVEYEAFKREVGLEVVSAVAEARLAQRQVTVWKTGVEQANDLTRLASQQYREGDINFITYLEHLATVRETKVAYVDALATYRTQLARLNQAVASTLIPDRKEVR
ncbi:MAG: TolC family protein [Candidatus Omnitrophota bacterium]|nr:TolC family protein [Candidatus Omnitrophota bacterium]